MSPCTFHKRALAQASAEPTSRTLDEASQPSHPHNPGAGGGPLNTTTPPGPSYGGPAAPAVLCMLPVALARRVAALEPAQRADERLEAQ